MFLEDFDFSYFFWGFGFFFRHHSLVSSHFKKTHGKERSHSLEKLFIKIITTYLIRSSHFHVKVHTLIPLLFELDSGLSAHGFANG